MTLLGPAVPVVMLAEQLQRASDFRALVLVGFAVSLGIAGGVLLGTFIGHRLAQAMLRPHVLSFLDVASAFKGTDLDLDLEQVRVAETSSVAEKTLEESKIRQRFGVIVLAIMGQDGQMSFNPAGPTMIHPSDVLIVMGERSKLNHMERELEG